MLKRVVKACGGLRVPTASTQSIVLLVLVTGAVVYYVHNTLTNIERSLPVKILEQRQDIGTLQQSVGELRNLVETSSSDTRGFQRILGKVDALDTRIDSIRSTYKLDNIMGTASLHAVLAPMLHDIRVWLTEGVHDYELTDEQRLVLVSTRVSDAYSRMQSLVKAADQTALSILEAESDKITSFRIQMVALLAGLCLGAAALAYYITRINAAQRALDEEHQRTQLALHAAHLFDWEWDVSSDRLQWGRDPTRLLGPADRTGGHPDLADLVVEEDAEVFRRAGRKASTEDGFYKLEFRIRRTDGVELWVESQGRRVEGDHGKAARVIGVSRDISERKRAEQEIHRYAYYDCLTGLPNRQHLVNGLESAIERSLETGCYGALLFMDLDHFKNINDSLGHATGDELLKQIAGRIQATVRTSDLVGRLGGDEFTVLLPGLSQNRDETRKIARRIGEEIQRKLASPYRVDGHDLQMSASIGISLFPLVGCNGEAMVGELLKNADTAMYRAKEAGRHTIKFYAASMQRRASRKLTLQRVIQQAMVSNHFRLDFQPQVDMSGRLIGIEALLRLDDSEVTGLDTDEIIDVAEESGLVLPLGDWVIIRACRHLRQWADAGLNVGRLSVNVSPSQFHQNDFVERVARIVAETGVEPSKLEMEITERLVMISVENAIAKMHALKKLGIQFAIDDFGTGYSSLAYLKRLPLDRIKIDKSFTQDVETDPSDAVIVETILSMAKSLGLEVIAEGVETYAAFETLTSRGCRFFQGHLFSHPLIEARLLEIIRGDRGLPPVEPPESRNTSAGECLN